MPPLGRVPASSSSPARARGRFGLARMDDLSTKRSMSTADRFRIGSVTKTFTATVVMQLVHEGKLALDDSVEAPCPDSSRTARAITYRQLLSHTSGLPDYFSNKRIFAPYPGGNLTYTWSHSAIVRISTRDKPIFAPGAKGMLRVLEHGLLHPRAHDRADHRTHARLGARRAGSSGRSGCTRRRFRRATRRPAATRTATRPTSASRTRTSAS